MAGRRNVVASLHRLACPDQARAWPLTPDRVAGPLAERPYDLRHAGVSLGLNAGVPAPDVAERTGRPVEALLKVYAKCIDGNRGLMNTGSRWRSMGRRGVPSSGPWP